MNNEWLKSLKVGDKVITSGSWGGRSINEVEKITPSGLIKVNGELYRNDGHIRGNSGILFEATPEAVKKIEEEKTIRTAICKLRELTTLTYQQAVEILKILEVTE